MLYIFDLDGTLVETYGTQPLLNVGDHLSALDRQGHELAVATNQAGLSWRIWTGTSKFPDVPSMARRFEKIAGELPVLQRVPWFVSVYDSRVRLDAGQYGSLVQDMIGACPTLKLEVQAIPDWRKPNPGMLVAAQKYFNCNQDAIVFIGDYQTDADAAAAAGIEFCWAEDFFSN